MKITIILILCVVLSLLLSKSIPVKSETFETCMFTEEVKKSRFSILEGEKIDYEAIKPVLPDVGKSCSEIMGWEGIRTKRLYLL